jgi:hypothetical protein
VETTRVLATVGRAHMTHQRVLVHQTIHSLCTLLHVLSDLAIQVRMTVIFLRGARRQGHCVAAASCLLLIFLISEREGLVVAFSAVG